MATDQRALEKRNARIERMYRGGATVRDIGAKMGLAFSHVADLLRSRNVPMRKRGGAKMNPEGRNQYSRRRRKAK